jgi:hypothetical protein
MGRLSPTSMPADRAAWSTQQAMAPQVQLARHAIPVELDERLESHRLTDHHGQ